MFKARSSSAFYRALYLMSCKTLQLLQVMPYMALFVNFKPLNPDLTLRFTAIPEKL